MCRTNFDYSLAMNKSISYGNTMHIHSLMQSAAKRNKQRHRDEERNREKKKRFIIDCALLRCACWGLRIAASTLSALFVFKTKFEYLICSFIIIRYISQGARRPLCAVAGQDHGIETDETQHGPWCERYWWPVIRARKETNESNRCVLFSAHGNSKGQRESCQQYLFFCVCRRSAPMNASFVSD